jgi:2-keto-3-deoxy-L-rhamnonate aldolase RhmA
MAQGLKQKIRSGERTIGFGAPVTVTREQLERAQDEHGPYDFLSTDAQHSAFSEPALVDFCNRADEVDLPVRLRIKHTSHTCLIGNLLDLGPTGVEVPQVESLETAREAAENMYYPPRGRRSVGGRERRRVQELADSRDYADWWNENGVLWLQIESLNAVLHAHIFALPGVDCFSFGPTDLTFDIEAHPNPPYGRLEDCVEAVARSLEGSQTALCYRNGTPDTRQHWSDLGVTVFLESPAL